METVKVSVEKKRLEGSWKHLQVSEVENSRVAALWKKRNQQLQEGGFGFEWAQHGPGIESGLWSWIGLSSFMSCFMSLELFVYFLGFDLVSGKNEANYNPGSQLGRWTLSA